MSPGAREFLTMLPIVCNDAVAVLFVFDLTRKSTLSSVKEWYRQVRGLNKVCNLLTEPAAWRSRPNSNVTRADGISLPRWHQV